MKSPWESSNPLPEKWLKIDLGEGIGTNCYSPIFPFDLERDECGSWLYWDTYSPPNLQDDVKVLRVKEGKNPEDEVNATKIAAYPIHEQIIAAEKAQKEAYNYIRIDGRQNYPRRPYQRRYNDRSRSRSPKRASIPALPTPAPVPAYAHFQQPMMQPVPGAYGYPPMYAPTQYYPPGANQPNVAPTPPGNTM